MNIEEVQTPALVLNVDALERNLRRMAEDCSRAGISLRPHTKTHRSPWVARKQMDLGAVGVCAAKLGEAEVLLKSGISDVLVTTEVTPAKAERAIDLTRFGKLTLVVDDREATEELNRRAAARGVTLDVLVDVNVGQDRTGIELGQAAELPSVIDAASNLRFAGLQGYEGHLQHVFDYETQRTRAFACYDRLDAVKQVIERAGVPVDWVTTAGTGTYRFAIERGLATEVQPGSYVVMDCVYSRIERSAYENALFVLAGVVSVNRPGQVVVDSGWKTLSIDGGPAAVKDLPDARYEPAGDEHGKVWGSDARKVGDVVWLVPSHCDTTINLFDEYTLIRDSGEVETRLPVATRGRSY